MKIVLMLFAVSLNAFSGQIANPLQLKFDQNFAAHRSVIETCLRKEPSTNSKIGCVDSLVFFTTLCRQSGTTASRSTYLPRQQVYFKQACQVLEETFNGSHSLSFFDLDAKVCRKGFETLGDRLVTLHQNKEFIDEFNFYSYEKKSCKEYRRFVHLCEYIDGSLKASSPTTSRKLPKIDFSTKPPKSCFNKNDATSVIGKDLLAGTRRSSSS